MIYVGIDVAKDKHDCFMRGSEGEMLQEGFTIPNTMAGFEDLYQRVSSVSENPDKVKVGLEATGHYGYNILGFLLSKGLPTFRPHPPPPHSFRHRQEIEARNAYESKLDIQLAVGLPPMHYGYHPSAGRVPRRRFEAVKSKAVCFPLYVGPYALLDGLEKIVSGF